MSNNVSLTSMLEEDVNEKEYIKSPFRYHRGLRVMLDNTCVTCGMEKLRRACVKGFIDEVDFKLMRYLLKYQFLSRRHLELCYAYDSESELTGEECVKLEQGRSNLKRRIKKLMSYGLVLRYYLTWDKEGERAGVERTPCFYGLSESAYKFLVKRNVLSYSNGSDRGRVVTEPGEEMMLARLVSNQFHIMFSHQHKERISDNIYFQSVAIKGYNFTVELVYRLSDSAYSVFNRDGYLAVLAVRKSEDWEKTFLLRLALLFEYAKWHPNRMGTPVVMVVCEDDLHIKEAFLAKYQKKETRNVTVYFTTDTEIMNEAVLSGVYRCELVDAADVPATGDVQVSVFDESGKVDVKDAAKLVKMEQLVLDF